ncbi:MAG: hypothetical protein ACLR4A_16775 [Christensenellales bacterium]
MLCEDALIAKIGENLTDDDARIIDAGGMRLAPGFIDVHTHGAAGVDVNAADEAGLRRIAAFFATQGVTAFNASVLTDTPETTEKCLGAIANVMSDRGKGAQLWAHIWKDRSLPENTRARCRNTCCARATKTCFALIKTSILA